MQKLLNRFTTCLWFDNDAEEAMRTYASIFENAKIGSVTHYGEAGHEVHHRPKGSVLTITLTIDGQELMGLNAGPVFTINPAISFYITCKSENEIDRLYEKLSAGGSVLMELNKYPFSEKYAWVKDKFGVSWQLNLTDKTSQKVSSCLMFTGDQKARAEEAIKFYTAIFKNSKIDYLVKYEAGEQAPGAVKHAAFELDGQQFIAMDSPIDHGFGFTPATSFIVNCESQNEIDEIWEKLQADGGAPGQCGWLTDKFGMSWQVVPTVVAQMMTDKDEAKREKALAAIMKSQKLKIDELEKAFNS
ncbi:MAG: VOC family protein [Candidatus Obscuribacterales bacterium]|nr:VOC family protein [Candidatus Obscuribacterales bacterium]